MLIVYWIRIIILLTLAYTSWQALQGNVPHHGWLQYYYLFAPWFLFYGSLKSWYRAYTWRRMMYAKNIAPDLSRGQKMPSKTRERKSFLEKASFFLLLLSCAAILNQFGVTGSRLWAGILSVFYECLKFIFSMAVA